MGLIWAILAPLGAIVVRFLKGMIPNASVKHSAIQTTSLVLLFAGGALGVYLGGGHQFISLRNSDDLPSKRRWAIWTCHYSYRLRSSWLWMAPSQNVYTQQTQTSSLVYAGSLMAWTICDCIRSCELRVGTINRSSANEMGYSLVGVLFWFHYVVFWRIYLSTATIR